LVLDVPVVAAVVVVGRVGVGVVGVVGGGVEGGGVEGGGVVGGGVEGGGVDGGGVVGGGVAFVVDVLIVGVGDFVVVGDFDEEGDFEADVVPVVPPTETLLPWLPPITLLTGCAGFACAPALCAATCDWVWVGSVVLPPRFKGVLPLLDISTATIATTPMPAAPIPANRKARLAGLPGSGTRVGASRYISRLVAGGKFGTTGRSEVTGPV
jgi:hypothetical protein